MTRTCAPDENTRITHIAAVPPCCPISGNPRAGSTLSVSYTPTTGLVFPVEDLEVMIREYVGGLGSIRAMEEMIQHIHRRVSDAVGVDVMVKAELRIAPPYGGDEQGMVIEVGADMLTTLAAELATLRASEAAALERVTVLEAASAHVLHDIDDLVANSEGVTGLHRNGDVAEWSDILEGGSFEVWLRSVETLRAALTPTADKEPKT